RLQLGAMLLLKSCKARLDTTSYCAIFRSIAIRRKLSKASGCCHRPVSAFPSRSFPEFRRRKGPPKSIAKETSGILPSGSAYADATLGAPLKKPSTESTARCNYRVVTTSSGKANTKARKDRKRGC